jgi:PAS domain S-box-containing protein
MNALADTVINLQSLLETHDQPFVVIDERHRIVACNRAFERAFGLGSEAIVGQLCYRLLHNQEVPCSQLGQHCPYVQVSEGTAAESAVHDHVDGHGKRSWVRVRGFPLRGSDGRLYVGELMDALPTTGRGDEDDVGMVGASPAFRRAIAQLERAARTATPVLLQGETGTGKTLAAAYLHRHSPRRDGPFVAVDCAALPESLFESEMFGHERGAFTGSVGSRRGLFELAHGGTLLMDEIGEVPLALQAKLLRVLDTGQFRRLGGRRLHHADVNVVCASNRPLAESARTGQFRADLYYRIAGFVVELPPLRERREDIPTLAAALLSRLRCARGQPWQLSAAALKVLCEYEYPGNVRELRNVLEVAAAYCDGEAITPEHLRMTVPIEARREGLPRAAPESRFELPVAWSSAAGAAVAPSPGTDPAQASWNPRSGASLRDVEEDYIRDLLERHHGRRRKVADVMGISERTLYRKLRRYGLG